MQLCKSASSLFMWWLWLSFHCGHENWALLPPYCTICAYSSTTVPYTSSARVCVMNSIKCTVSRALQLMYFLSKLTTNHNFLVYLQVRLPNGKKSYLLINWGTVKWTWTNAIQFRQEEMSILGRLLNWKATTKRKKMKKWQTFNMIS